MASEPEHAIRRICLIDREAVITELADFIDTLRSIVGRDKEEPLSLEDLYFLADCLNLSGVIYLEKLEETRHVNVLLCLTSESLGLYDPLLGYKYKPYTPLFFGLYALPVGALKDEFEKTLGLDPIPRSENPWPYIEERGRKLMSFLEGHAEFGPPRGRGITGFPPLQDPADTWNCAPISLYFLSLHSRDPFTLLHTKTMSPMGDSPTTLSLDESSQCSAT